MFCTKCGAQLRPGVKFCFACGAAVTPKAAEIPQAPVVETPVVETPVAETPVVETPVVETPVAEAPVVEAPVVETPVVETPVVETPVAETPVVETPVAETPQAQVQAPVAVAEAPAAQAPDFTVPDFGVTAPQAGKKKGKGKVVAIVALCLALVGGLAAACVFLLPGLLGGGQNTQAFVYRDGSGGLYYMADPGKNTKALPINGVGAALVRFSDDGKTLYIYDYSQSLYVTTLSHIKKGDQPQRVDKNVYSSSITADGRLLYLKEKGEGYALCCYDGEDSFELARGVTDDFTLSGDEESVYYTVRSKFDGYDLYTVAIQDGAKPQLLAQDVSIMLSDYGADTLLFARGVQGKDGYTYDICSCAPGGEVKVLVTGADGVFSDPKGADDFYYTRQVRTQRSLYDLVSDDLAQEDASLLEDEPEEPDWFGEYYPETLWMRGRLWYYTDAAGADHPVDLDYLPSYVNTAIPSAIDQDLIADAAWETASALYDEDYEAYQAITRQLYGAAEREEMREMLREETYDQVSYELYHYTGRGDGDKVATCRGAISAGIPGVVFYTKAETLTPDTVVDIQDLDRWTDIYDYLADDEVSGQLYVAVNGVESRVDVDDDVSLINVYAMSDSEVVLELSDGDGSWLESWDVGDDGISFAHTVSDDNVYVSRLWTGDGDGALYFFINVSSDAPDLCRYQSGKTTLLAEDVYVAHVLPQSGVAFAGVDSDSSGGAELIRADSSGKATPIADFASSFQVIDRDTVLYTTGDDLYCWDGKDSHRVARDVDSYDYWTAARPDRDVVYIYGW